MTSAPGGLGRSSCTLGAMRGSSRMDFAPRTRWKMTRRLRLRRRLSATWSKRKCVVCEKEVPPGECVCCVSSVCLSVCLSVVFVCEGGEGIWLMLRPTFARAGFEERSVVPEMFSAHYIHTTIHSHTYTTYLPHTHTHTHTIRKWTRRKRRDG